MWCRCVRLLKKYRTKPLLVYLDNISFAKIVFSNPSGTSSKIVAIKEAEKLRGVTCFCAEFFPDIFFLTFLSTYNNFLRDSFCNTRSGFCTSSVSEVNFGLEKFSQSIYLPQIMSIHFLNRTRNDMDDHEKIALIVFLLNLNTLPCFEAASTFSNM